MTNKEKVDAAIQKRIDAGWPAQLKKKIRAHMAKHKTSKNTTERTKQVTTALENAGVTESELKRLRGE
jgi:hypothetical protein